MRLSLYSDLFCRGNQNFYHISSGNLIIFADIDPWQKLLTLIKENNLNKWDKNGYNQNYSHQMLFLKGVITSENERYSAKVRFTGEKYIYFCRSINFSIKMSKSILSVVIYEFEC